MNFKITQTQSSNLLTYFTYYNYYFSLILETDNCGK